LLKEIFCAQDAGLGKEVEIAEIEIGTGDDGDETTWIEIETRNATDPLFPAHGAEELGRYHTA
jgi:hypothetical protein